RPRVRVDLGVPLRLAARAALEAPLELEQQALVQERQDRLERDALDDARAGEGDIGHRVLEQRRAVVAMLVDRDRPLADPEGAPPGAPGAAAARSAAAPAATVAAPAASASRAFAPSRAARLAGSHTSAEIESPSKASRAYQSGPL